MSASARGVFAHRFKLGGDVAQGHLRIGHGNADDERHQAVFGRFATRALDQIRLDKMLLDEAADGTPQTLDRPQSRRALRIKHPHDIFPGMIWPHSPDRWEPGVH